MLRMDEEATPCGAVPVRHADEIIGYLRATSASLGSSFRNFWPADEGGRNDPCEGNVSFHLAHQLLGHGFSTFAEVWHPFLPAAEQRSKRGRIDLLGIAPGRDWFIAWEAKRILCNKFDQSILGMLDDVRRLESFWLNTRQQSGKFGEHRADVIRNCHCGIAVLGGLSWVASNSTAPLLSRWGTGSAADGSICEPLASKLATLNATWVEPIPIESHSKSGMYFLLAALFEIPHRSGSGIPQHFTPPAASPARTPTSHVAGS